jgi:hypothetical protein
VGEDKTSNLTPASPEGEEPATETLNIFSIGSEGGFWRFRISMMQV